MRKKKQQRPNRKLRAIGSSSLLYVLFVMFLATVVGLILSGGIGPTDPTGGPESPPTLEPYSTAEDYGQQKIIMKSDLLQPDAKENLQLKTFKVTLCGDGRAIDFLIDTSGSMEDDNKMQKTKTALREFTKMLGKKSVIGIQTFSKSVEEKVPLSYYGDVKNKVNDTIDNLKPDGWTRTRDGMKLAKTKLDEAIRANKFSGYRYSLILITDGVPEIPPPQGADTRDCYIRVDDPVTAPAKRCFVKDQDPRVPTNIATEIKNLGVTIYSIGIYSQTSSDKQLIPYLERLLKDVATSPDEPYYSSSINANKLSKILEQICEPMAQ